MLGQQTEARPLLGRIFIPLLFLFCNGPWVERNHREPSPTIPNNLHRSRVPLNHTRPHNGRLPRCTRSPFPPLPVRPMEHHLQSTGAGLGQTIFSCFILVRTGSHRGELYTQTFLMKHGAVGIRSRRVFSFLHHLVGWLPSARTHHRH